MDSPFRVRIMGTRAKLGWMAKLSQRGLVFTRVSWRPQRMKWRPKRKMPPLTYQGSVMTWGSSPAGVLPRDRFREKAAAMINTPSWTAWITILVWVKASGWTRRK